MYPGVRGVGNRGGSNGGWRRPSGTGCGRRPGGGGEPVRWYGRALMAPKPLTVLSSVPWWWALWIRSTWPLARLGRVDQKLRALSFIHFAHWSLVGRWPRDRASGPDRGAARTLVFLTRFDGSDVQYIDA